jgi:hypothetical protein
VRSVRGLQITLELVPGSEPIRGRVCGETATRSFTGWMQLITVLQACIEEDQTHLSDTGHGGETSTYTDAPEDGHVTKE